MTDQPAPVALVSTRRTGPAIIEQLQNKPNQLALDLKTAQENGRQTRGQEKALKAAAALVFAYWSARFDHPKAWLDNEREKIIVCRLKETDGDLSELLYAIDGGTKDEWVMGTHPRAQHRNDGVGYIFRSREKVEQLAERCRGHREGKRHRMVIKYVDQHMNGNGASNGEATNGSTD